MWAFVMALFSFFYVTINNFVVDHLHLVIAWFIRFLSGPIKIFVLNHLKLVVMTLFTFFFTFFSFQIKNFLWDHRYILLVGSNVKALTREIDILKKKLMDVQKEIEKDEASMKKPTEEVEGWMNRVQALLPSVESVVSDYGNRSYFCNVYSISIQSVNKLKEVRQEAEFIKSVRAYTTSAPPPMVREVPTPTLAAPGGEIESKLQVALDFLRVDDAQKTLGVWGMGGVGKTTLLKHINNAMVKDTSFGFDRVVFVIASRGCTTGKIQMSIAKELGLSEGGDHFRNISNYLRNKSFLILVDDLWEYLDIEEMGIPLPLGVIEGHKRKMILVSRDHQVLNNMGVSQSIRVECLSRDAARLLFQENVGTEAISSHPRIIELANQVADKCHGLPQALITIGRAMAENRSIVSWENAVEDLRMSISNFSENNNITGNPLPLLKVSYDYLKDEKKQQCLLHCALWPEDYKIPKDKLIQCWMGHGLLGEFNNLQEAYRKGHATIESLQKASLLEHAESGDDELKDDYVKLHDLIRDMALWIACDCGVNKNKWIVRAGQDLQKAPRDKILWREAHKISLMFNKIKSLTSEIQSSPNLTTLMLQSNKYLVNGGLRMFNDIESLRSEIQSITTQLLLLNGYCDGEQRMFNDIESLRSEMQSLTTLIHLLNGYCDGGLRVFGYFNSLKYLDISWCRSLESFPPEICKLTKLEYLNISDTGIGSLPEELKYLVNMKYLIARNVPLKSRVPPELLSNLVNLIELDLFGTGDKYFSSSVIDNLDCLEGRLKGLGITVTPVSNLQKLIQLSAIPISSLYLRKMKGLDSSIELLSRDFLGSQHIRSNLKQLTLLNCISVEEVVVEGKHQLNIERLNLYGASRLKEIKWKQVEPRDVLQKLRQVEIYNGNSLKNIEWAMYLPCLEILHLVDCQMEQMFGEEAGAAWTKHEEEDRSTFPSLSHLYLSHMPKLSSISHQPLTFPSLERLTIFDCTQLKKLPFRSSSSCTKLREIRVDEATWNGIDLEDNMQATLKPLLTLINYA